jgi:hypothetical protein
MRLWALRHSIANFCSLSQEKGPFAEAAAANAAAVTVVL